MRVRVRVCVCVCDLREDVNVVMNQEKKLVIGAIDRNHLMLPLGQNIFKRSAASSTMTFSFDVFVIISLVYTTKISNFSGRS